MSNRKEERSQQCTWRWRESKGVAPAVALQHVAAPGLSPPAVRVQRPRVQLAWLSKSRQRVGEWEDVALRAEDVVVRQVAHHPVLPPKAPGPCVKEQVKVLEGLRQEEGFHVISPLAGVHVSERGVPALGPAATEKKKGVGNSATSEEKEEKVKASGSHLHLDWIAASISLPTPRYAGSLVAR